MRQLCWKRNGVEAFSRTRASNAAGIGNKMQISFNYVVFPIRDASMTGLTFPVYFEIFARQVFELFKIFSCEARLSRAKEKDDVLFLFSLSNLWDCFVLYIQKTKT